MQAKHQIRPGFTYTEMMIVMLVMGILSAIAAPSYLSTLTEYRVDTASRRVVADLQYARSEAQRNSQSRTVQFDAVNDSYTLVGIDDLDRAADGYVVELVDEPFSSALVSATFGADSNVIFDRYGRPDSGGTVVVQSGSVQRTISLAVDGTASVL